MPEDNELQYFLLSNQINYTIALSNPIMLSFLVPLFARKPRDIQPTCQSLNTLLIRSLAPGGMSDVKIRSSTSVLVLYSLE